MSLLGSIIPGWKWVSGTIGVVVIGLLAWWIIATFVIGPRDLSSAERKALLIAASGIESKLIERLDATDRYQLSIAVLKVRMDTEGGEAEDVVTSTLKKNPRFSIPKDGILDDIKKGAKGWLFGDDVSGPQKILESRGELDGVLLLELNRSQKRLEVGATLEGRLFEHAVSTSGKRTNGVEAIDVAATGRVDIESGVALEPGQTEIPPGTFWRDVGLFFLSIILALGIPFLWLPLTDWIQGNERRRNTNLVAMVYVVFVVASAVTPYALLFLFNETGGGAVAWIAGTVLAIFAGVWTYAMHSAWAERV